MFLIRLTLTACLWLMPAHRDTADTNSWARGATWGCQLCTNRVSLGCSSGLAGSYSLTRFCLLLPTPLDMWRFDDC